MKDLTTHFEEIIVQLKAGRRPMIQLDPEIIAKIKITLTNPQNKQNYSDIKKALCILDHSREPIPEITNHLIELLNPSTPKEILICTLEVTHKHIINDYFRKGIKLPSNYLESIKNLFTTNDWELREWLLRTVDACGSNAKFFRAEIQAIKPNLLSVFNVHARYCVEIMQLLESRLK